MNYPRCLREQRVPKIQFGINIMVPLIKPNCVETPAPRKARACLAIRKIYINLYSEQTSKPKLQMFIHHTSLCSTINRIITNSVAIVTKFVRITFQGVRLNLRHAHLRYRRCHDASLLRYLLLHFYPLQHVLEYQLSQHR